MMRAREHSRWGRLMVLPSPEAGAVLDIGTTDPASGI